MYGSSDMVKIFIPVSLCMLIVVLCVRNIEDYSDDHVIPAPYVIYREPESEPTTKFWKSLVNAGVLMGIIVVFTCILVLLFYLRCFAGTLIIVSAVITLTLMQLLPKWTTWTLLVVIAIWDLVAVLTPCGPLRLLVSIAEKRGDPLNPVLIYTGTMYFSQSSERSGENKP
ncbi:hypothetical protein GCK32_016700, partial [Trichostrongylus colubriformis]